MRDPNRIKPILAALERYWILHPDMRLGQIVGIAAALAEHNVVDFYCEDDDMLFGLRRLLVDSTPQG